MTQPKKERRERAAKRLIAQLEAGTKPRRSSVCHRMSSRKWSTVYATDPLTDADMERIKRELATLQA